MEKNLKLFRALPRMKCDGKAVAFAFKDASVLITLRKSKSGSSQQQRDMPKSRLEVFEGDRAKHET